MRNRLLVTPVALAIAAAAAAAQPTTDAAAPSVTSSTDSIARHAAARAFLEVSRSRDRQRVLLYDSLLSAQSELASDCVNRAAEGRRLTGCGITSLSATDLHTTLKAHEDEIIDRVMVVAEEVYADRFTVAELKEISHFFETPVGRKYAGAYPILLDSVQSQKRKILEDFLLHEVRGPAKQKVVVGAR